MSPRMSIAVIAAAFGFACASAKVMTLDKNATRPATSPDSVALLLDEPEQPYAAIALIEVSDQGWRLSLATLRDKLAKEAAQLGGQGVIVTRQSTQSGAVLLPVGDSWVTFNTETERLVGKVIVFTDSH